MKKIWPFSFNFILYAGIATMAPFIVLYYQSLGFTGTQIGLLTGITPLINFFSATLWTGFADVTRRHRLLMSLALLGASIGLFLFPLLSAFAPVLLIAIFFSVFWAPVTPFADSATMFMLTDQKEMYSRVRLGATLGFGLAAPIAGALVQNHGLRFAFWGCTIMFLLGLVVSQKLVYGQSQSDRPTRGRIRALMSNPQWLLFLVVAFAGGLGMAGYNNYLFPYMKELGANESTMGFALLVGMVSEIPALFFGNRLIRILKPYGLLMLSMAVTGLRMVLFAASGTPNLILAFQLLNGLTFPTMWVAGVSYADENAPEGMSATVQGLFSAMVLGFGTAVGGLTGGLLLGSMGGRGLYLIFGIIVLIIVAMVALIQRRLLPEQTLSAGG
jgi:PPP family 3-phenylpropionic acid transporter